MPLSKLCSRMLLIHLLNIILLTKIVSSRNVPEISSQSRDTVVTENWNISKNNRGHEFLKEDASAIVEQIANLPSNTVRTSKRNRLNKPKKIDSESYGSKILLGIVHNDKQTQTPKPVEDQTKSQTIVKYFNQEDYNGLKINPIVVADIYDDSEIAKKNRIRNRKEILDLEQEESPIKPDSDTDEKTENKHLEGEQNINEQQESPNEDKENENSEELQTTKDDSDTIDEKASEENAPKENEENEKIKQETENDEIREDVEVEDKNDEENGNVKESKEYKPDEEYEEKQNVNDDDESDSLQDEEEYKENPIQIENNEHASNTEEERPNGYDKSGSDDKIKESARVYNNEDLKQENYWNPYDDLNIQKKPTSEYNNENTDRVNQEESPKEYEENEDDQSEKLTEKDNEQKGDIDSEDKASILKNEDTSSNQGKSAEITHADAKKKKKGGKHKHSSGKGKEKHSHVYGHKGEKGLKAYKGHHEESKGSKGYHDKEQHGKKYKDEKGLSKKHHEERGHHGEHHKGEKGEKAYNFAEDGKHTKGHSTNGEHNIHKNDEYNKKEVFYDEHHEGGEHEKHGGFDFEDHFEKAGFKKGSHHKKGDHEDHYGKKSHHAKGKHYHDDKGHKKAGGHDEHYNHHSKYGKKKGSSGKKHWGYEKGTGGHGGKKKYTEKQEETENSPQHIKEASSIYNDKEDGNNEKYINDDDHDRSTTNDEVEDTPKKENAELKQEEVENEEESNVDDEESESSEIKIKKEKLPLNSNHTNNEKHNNRKSRNHEKNEEKFDWDKIEKFDADDASAKEQSKVLPEATQKQKIYVIIPESNDERIQPEEDLEKEPSTLQHTSKSEKISKLLDEPFPEEHRKRLSEIDSVIQKFGENVKNKRMSPEYNNRKIIAHKPRQFSVA